MSGREEPEAETRSLSELEAALRALVPQTPRLNRDRLMFLAGQASVAPRLRQPASPLGAAFSRQHAGWGWPVALAAMSTVAASLFVALVMRPVSQVVAPPVQQAAAQPAAPQESATAVAAHHVEPGPATTPSAVARAVSPDWLAWNVFARPGAGVKDELSYPALRQQVLLNGLESWKPLVSESAPARREETWPVPYREELQRWLEEQRHPSGARS
jgi:hypothetical protein